MIQNCTLGTAKFCLGYASKVLCKRLPVDTELLDQSSLLSLYRSLHHWSATDIESLIAAGALSVAFLIAIFHWTFWRRPSLMLYTIWQLPPEILIVVSLNLISFICYFCATILLWIFFSATKSLSSNIIVQTGSLVIDCTIMLCCTAILAFCCASKAWRQSTCH